MPSGRCIMTQLPIHLGCPWPTPQNDNVLRLVPPARGSHSYCNARQQNGRAGYDEEKKNDSIAKRTRAARQREYEGHEGSQRSSCVQPESLLATDAYYLPVIEADRAEGQMPEAGEERQQAEILYGEPGVEKLTPALWNVPEIVQD